MAETRLSLFGTLHLCIAQSSFVFAPSPIANLLGYLALYTDTGRAIPRALLAEKLWPHLPADRARLRLNDTLYRLRQKLGESFACLLVDYSSISLASITTDVVEFKRLSYSDQLNDWRTAIGIYSGELLDGIDTEWLLVPRVALRDVYLTTLAKLCTALHEAGHWFEALEYAHRWMLADPYNEDPYRLLMRIDARMGRHVEALQTYDRLVAILDEEFQSTPLPETRALANAIRAEYHAVPISYARALSLIGRYAERTMLLRLIEQAWSGRGGMVLLEGEAGIGKTRLLEAVADGAGWRNMRVIWGVLPAEQPGAALAPLDQALRAAFTGIWGDLVQAQLPSAPLDLIRAITEQHSRGGSADAPRVEKTPFEHQIDPLLLPMLLQALSNVGPHVIILDNLHLAGVQFWHTLQTCAAEIANSRLLIILSYRRSELRDHPAAWQAAWSLDRAHMLPRVILEDLSFDECADLARAIDPMIDPAAAQAVYERSGGHPLLFQDLIAARPDRLLSVTARAWLAAQLAKLNQAAYQALEILSAVAAHGTLALLRQMADPETLCRLPDLIADGWIVEHAGTYSYRREVIREYIYESLAADRRAALHRCAGRALEQLRLSPELCAWQYEQAQDWLAALRAHQRAAGEMIRVRNYESALLSYMRASSAAEAAGVPSPDIKVLRIAREAAAQQSARTQPHQPRYLTVRLARAGTPLGRPLKEAEFVTVKWTIHAGETDDAIARTGSKVSLRRHRIERLVAEAQAQGAEPTDSDLAQALQVTERTILMDMQALRATGHILMTRRRRIS